MQGLEFRIAPAVRKEFDKYRAQCMRTGESITNEWIVQIALIEDKHTPKASPNQLAARVKALETNRTPPAQSPIVAVIPEAFQRGPLTEEGKEWLMKHNGCFFCRFLGHEIENCKKLAR